MLISSFSKPVGLFDNWFNKVVAKITGGEYCHSEFIFSWTETECTEFLVSNNLSVDILSKWKKYLDNDKINICFYVLWGDETTYRLLQAHHNNPFYRMPNDVQYTNVPMKLSKEKEFKLAGFLFNQLKKDYDYYGALTYFVPFRGSNDEYQSYFCSQLMVCALQHIQFFTAINPSSVTPNKLYELIQNHPDL